MAVNKHAPSIDSIDVLPFLNMGYGYVGLKSQNLCLSKGNRTVWNNISKWQFPNLNQGHLYSVGLSELSKRMMQICNWGATCNAWMHKRFTTMQLNNVEIWKGSSRMKSPALLRSCFVLLDLEQWNKKRETHQSLIDIHAWVSRKLNSYCNYAHRKNRKTQEYGQSMAIQFWFPRRKGTPTHQPQ